MSVFPGQPVVSVHDAIQEFATPIPELLSTTPIVTDVELLSTAPLGGNGRRVFQVGALTCAVVTVLIAAIALATRPAAADSLSSARAEAAQINAQLQIDQNHLDVISQQYDAAIQQVSQINGQISQTKATIVADQAEVSSDQANLRTQAIRDYMTGTDDAGLASLFSSGGAEASVTQEYRSVATSNVSNAIDSLNVAQGRLSAQEAQLQASEAKAHVALDAATAARNAAEATVGSQQATLSQETGRVASFVAQQRAAQQAAQHAAFEGRLHGPVLSNPPGNGSAGQAVAAAESQIGVPYQWGAEDPGHGFDCSGLTQWSWGQAGVGIPRTAQAQYDSVVHVPLSDMEPGDLVFWGDGPGDIYHVGIYVGNGDVVDAPQTGQDVQIQPIWNGGLVGAGRP